MKTIKVLVFGIMLMLAGSAQSQLSINVHIGSPPAWGPDGYSNDVRYYYLPDIEAYYDIRTSMFIYISGNQWVHRSYLPTRYRNYDLYHGYKVVMNDYRGNSPYGRFKEHKMKYGRGYRGNEQRNIGERNNNHGRENIKYQPNRNENYQKGQNRIVDYGKGQETKNNNRGNDKGNDRGNGKDKNDGHDNGNRR
jgi:hypothetical protein